MYNITLSLESQHPNYFAPEEKEKRYNYWFCFLIKRKSFLKTTWLFSFLTCNKVEKNIAKLQLSRQLFSENSFFRSIFQNLSTVTYSQSLKNNLKSWDDFNLPGQFSLWTEQKYFVWKKKTLDEFDDFLEFFNTESSRCY